MINSQIVFEEAAKGELSQKAMMDAAQTALKFLANASAHASREHRKLAIQNMNPRLGSLYSFPTLTLFGDGFCKKAKERDEEIKCLNQARFTQSTYPKEGRQSYRSGESRPPY